MPLMPEHDARKIIAAAGIVLPSTLSDAKADAVEWMSLKEIEENGSLYTALFVISQLSEEKVVVSTLADLERRVRRREKIPRSKPYRRTN